MVCYRYRMLWRRTFAVLLALAMLALPAASYAQSAGDDQYQDPLAGQGNHTGGGHSGSSTPSTAPATSTPSTPSTPTTASTSTSTSTGATTSSDPATAAQASNGQLPRTGFDVIVTFELGLAMLLLGLVSHRLLVLRDRR